MAWVYGYWCRWNCVSEQSRGLTERASFIPAASYTHTEWGANLCHSKSHCCPPRSIVLWQREREVWAWEGGLRVRGSGCAGKTGWEGKNEAGEMSAGGGADIHQNPLLLRLNAGVWIKHCLLPFPAGPLEKRAESFSRERERERERERNRTDRGRETSIQDVMHTVTFNLKTSCTTVEKKIPHII